MASGRFRPPISRKLALSAEYAPFVSHSADCQGVTNRRSRRFHGFAVVWQLPTEVDNDVAQVPPKSTYAEPTVMWRLCNTDDNRRAFAMIVPHGSKATAGWFSQGIPQESRDFATWHDAITWLEVKLQTLRLRGWRLDDPAE